MPTKKPEIDKKMLLWTLVAEWQRGLVDHIEQGHHKAYDCPVEFLHDSLDQFRAHMKRTIKERD